MWPMRGALNAHRVYKINSAHPSVYVVLPLFAFCFGHLMETLDFCRLVRGGIRVPGGPDPNPITLTVRALPAAGGSTVEV